MRYCGLSIVGFVKGTEFMLLPTTEVIVPLETAVQQDFSVRTGGAAEEASELNDGELDNQSSWLASQRWGGVQRKILRCFT